MNVIENHKLNYYMNNLSKNHKYLEKIYDLVRIPVFNYSLSFVKNKEVAEDILQDVLIKIYNNKEKYNKQEKAINYILTITKNESLTYLRKNKKIQEVDDEIFNNLSTYINYDDKLLLKSLLNKLTEEERTIVILIAIIGYKNKEVSEYLNIPISTVLSKYNRSIKKLRKYVEEDINE